MHESLKTIHGSGPLEITPLSAENEKSRYEHKGRNMEKRRHLLVPIQTFPAHKSGQEQLDLRLYVS